MKDVFNKPAIELVAIHLSKYYDDFDLSGFISEASSNILELELKERAEQIYLTIKKYLPDDFETSVNILINTLKPVKDNQDLSEVTTDESGVAGWMILPYSQYVGMNGEFDLECAMAALKAMTKRFSSEFGIRFLLLKRPEDVLQILSGWTENHCHHVRRLISEGTRPLLPWAMQLPMIKNNPNLVMPLLEKLKSDPSEYVRRSVANHLNDVAKSHPDFVALIARKWLEGDDSKTRYRMVKHACRTLIKQGHPDVLKAFGYAQDLNLLVNVTLESDEVRLGNSLEINAVIESVETNLQPLLVDYVIYHLKKNGSLQPKVFKWKSFEIKPKQSTTLIKPHPFKMISTRKYYSGIHKVALLINGKL